MSDLRTWASSEVEIANYALPYIDDQKAKNALIDSSSSWINRDPIEALEWFEGNVKEQAVIDQMRFKAIEQNIWGNPAQAAETLTDLPEGNERQETYVQVAKNWAESNLDSAPTTYPKASNATSL
jgi:hypothetical protein